MAEPKTRPTLLSARAFLDSIPDRACREECIAVADMMREATAAEAVMWGSNIVGFGTYRARYANGRETDWCRVAFAPRKSALTLYLMDGFAAHRELLQRLGKFKTGKSCLHLRRLEDVDRTVLRELIVASVEHMKRQYPV